MNKVKQSKEIRDKEFNKVEIQGKDIPGINQPMLELGVNVNGSAGGGKVLIFNRLSSVGIGLQEFNGFGFKPSSYTIQATRTAITTSGYPCYSDGAYDGINQITRQIGDGYSRILTDRVLRLFYNNQGGGTTTAFHNNFTNDGIILDFTSSSEDCDIVITAYK